MLPDQFYATTNYATEVRVNGMWMPVANPEMDCAIVIDDGGARRPSRRPTSKRAKR